MSSAARFIERWNDPKAVDLIRGLRRILLEAKKLPVPQSLSQIDKETAITLALNFFEEMSIAVHTKQVEEKVLKDFFRTGVLESYAALEQWIKQRRIERNQPTGYIEFEKLFRRRVS